MEFFAPLQPYMNYFLAFSFFTFVFEIIGLRFKYSSILSLLLLGGLYFFYPIVLAYFSLISSFFSPIISILIGIALIGVGALIRASKERRKKMAKAIRQQVEMARKVKV